MYLESYHNVFLKFENISDTFFQMMVYEGTCESAVSKKKFQSYNFISKVC